MRGRHLALVVAGLLMTACSGDTATGTTTTEPDPTTTSEAIAPTTTAVATTTTSTTSTTTSTTTTTTSTSTTTTVPLPSQVTGLTVGLGGGSGEVAVTWNANPEADISHYNVYFSQMPGGAKSYVRSVAPSETIGSKVGFIDSPRDQIDGQTCYIVRAVNPSGEGPASAEACFDHTV